MLARYDRYSTITTSARRADTHRRKTMKAHFEKETGKWVITHGSKWGRIETVGHTFADALATYCRIMDSKIAKKAGVNP